MKEGELALHFTDCLGQTIPRLVVVLSATRAELATSGALSQSERNLMTALINRDPLAGDMGFVILADTCGIGEPESDVTEQQKAEAPFAVLESKSPVLASPKWKSHMPVKAVTTGPLVALPWPPISWFTRGSRITTARNAEPSSPRHRA
jgi:hypothetical protein